ncbi:hypothetical protein [Streptomyces hilarionis]|uniref:hypothetical protein n=1 Tax=Streptomyces hilarionis TaxID=2839954 RepID=UPI002119CE7E|nr:hypothetical protein [Streptomyces hilarionis]MCQ9130606.1 hypothetical protein [Streptomyces hilarionis]
MNESYEQGELEEWMREILAKDAYTIHPSSAPYPAIRRRGLAERRRRVAVTGAVLAALAAVPVGAYAVNGGGGGRGADTAAPNPSVSAPHAPAAKPSSAPDDPARPATKGQLLDGITFEQAAQGLKACLRAESAPPGSARGLGKAKDYRIVLALKKTGDSNSAGDGINVVAVKEKPAGFRVVCTLEGGEASGISVSSSDAGPPDAGPVLPDVNGGKLYQQSFIDKGHWKLPFRWGVIGTVEPSVAKVTVSYGGSRATAVLDGPWFVAAGMLNRQVTLAPHIKGYDAAGKLVYDSDTDSTYQRTLP